MSKQSSTAKASLPSKPKPLAEISSQSTYYDHNNNDNHYYPKKENLVESLFSMEWGVYMAFHHGKFSAGKMIGKLNLNFANP